MRKPFRSIFLTVSIALSVATLFYAVTFTATADPFVRPYAAALGIALLVILVLHGLIDADRAEGGLLVSVFSLLGD